MVFGHNKSVIILDGRWHYFVELRGEGMIAVFQKNIHYAGINESICNFIIKGDILFLKLQHVRSSFA